MTEDRPTPLRPKAAAGAFIVALASLLTALGVGLDIVNGLSAVALAAVDLAIVAVTFWQGVRRSEAEVTPLESPRDARDQPLVPMPPPDPT